MDGPLKELAAQFQTDTMATAEHMSQTLEVFTTSCGRDLQAFEKEWKERREELIELSSKTVASAATQLRQPVYATVEGLEQRLSLFEERMTTSIRNLETKAEEGILKQFSLLERFAREGRTLHLFLTFFFVAGLAAGMMLEKFLL